MATSAVPSQLELDEEACRDAGVDASRLRRVPERLAPLVSEGPLPCLDVVVERRGRRLLRWIAGFADAERRVPLEREATWRIYSMTKPIVTVALLSLLEEGLVGLDDEVATWLPAFAEPRVYRGGSGDALKTAAASTPLSVRHLLTHTSGLTYDFFFETVVDELYRRHKLTTQGWPGDLGSWVDELASLPLLFEPGQRWNYSVSIDVVGRLIEVLSGQPLDQALAERVFNPLGMDQTGFWVSERSAGSLVACWAQPPSGDVVVFDRPESSRWLERPSMLSGGGGLVSTTEDYVRFCRMLLGGGALGGHRVLGPRTLALAMQNHLPGGRTIDAMGPAEFSGASTAGLGFGLGGSVLVDPVAAGLPGAPGRFSWGGIAGTTFFVVPRDELSVVAMTQLIPPAASPLRRRLAVLVDQALVD